MNRSALRSAAAALVVLTFVGWGGSTAAHAEDAPKVPEQVAEYFAGDLVPRLIDLYGSNVDGVAGIDFDDTTKVGDVLRVYEWTPEFVAGRSRTEPTRATNSWVAVVSARGGPLGLATVWINPVTDDPELASFDSAGLAMRIAAAPENSRLVHDESAAAWFALSGDSLVSLVDGTSGVTGTTTLGVYQWSHPAKEQTTEPQFSGIAVSALVLGIVVLGLAIFVLLPVGRRPSKDDSDEWDDEGPDGEGPDNEDPVDAAPIVAPKTAKPATAPPKPKRSPTTPKSAPAKPKTAQAKPKTAPAKPTPKAKPETTQTTTQAVPVTPKPEEPEPEMAAPTKPSARASKKSKPADDS